MAGTRVDIEGYGAPSGSPAGPPLNMGSGFARRLVGVTGSGDLSDLAMMEPPRPTLQGPTLDLSQPSMDLSTLSGQDVYGLDIPDPMAGPDVQRRHEMLQNVMASARSARSWAQWPTPQRAATMKMPAKTVTGKAPSRTQQALTFAKALGFVGEEEASPEYAEAAAKALAKMTRGMSVAKLLSAAQRPKAQAEFQRLVEQEAAKMRPKSAAPLVRGEEIPSV